MDIWKAEFRAGRAFAPGLSFDGSRITLELEFYAPDAAQNLRDCMKTPLTLTAPAQPDDGIEIICAGASIALCVNGALADEEWPYGCTDFPRQLSGDFRVTQDPGTCPGTHPAIPLRTVTEIQGFRPAPGVNVGDCMPMADGDTLRIFYLYDRRHHRSKWGLGAHQWAQITTRDLKSWTMQPIAVGIGDASEGSICTGSVIRSGDTYHAYFAIRSCDGSPAHLARAESSDGVHFTKKDGSFTLPEPYDAPSARDPKVYREKDGYAMLVTTSRGTQGCLARLESPDLQHWTLREPELLTPGIQPECPDRFRFAGHEYLVYGQSGTTHYLIRNEESGAWEAPAGDGIIVNRTLRVPKAAVWKDRLIVAGFVIEPEGTGWGGVMRLYEGFADADGMLRFEELRT